MKIFNLKFGNIKLISFLSIIFLTFFAVGCADDSSDNSSGSNNNTPTTDTTSFIVKWRVDKVSSVWGSTVRIKTHSDYTYDYIVDWGEGTIETNQTTESSHRYDSVGTYTIKISGLFPGIRLGHGICYVNQKWTEEQNLKFNNKNYLSSVEQWGTQKWKTFKGALRDCPYVTINATDTPDLSQVTDMSDAFNRAEIFNYNISNWDVSNVTNMSGMFYGAYKFNQDLSLWDASNTTNMSTMFQFAYDFNQDISAWDTSNVTNMYRMFFNTSDFNQNLSSWNVEKVTDYGSFSDHWGGGTEPNWP
ncbi:MAG: hypothetical protein DRQ51_10110 [Gammaproteobacteria bacterium]|nr:MAG: hypothetical protein DRQ51_10110 [Gammaproteobacteria bacterium]